MLSKHSPRSELGSHIWTYLNPFSCAEHSSPSGNCCLLAHLKAHSVFWAPETLREHKGGLTPLLHGYLFSVAPLRVHHLGTYGPWGSLQIIFERSQLILHNSQACFLFLSRLKLHMYHRAHRVSGLSAQQAICCASASSARTPSPVNQCRLHREGRKKVTSIVVHQLPYPLQAISAEDFSTTST